MGPRDGAEDLLYRACNRMFENAISLLARSKLVQFAYEARRA